MLIPDFVMCLNFLPHSLRFWLDGHLRNTVDCRISAFFAIAQITALNLGAIFIALTTWRMIVGVRTPDRIILLYVMASWAAGVVLASLFMIGDTLGPYKGLYCCIKEQKYRSYAVLPILLVTALAVFSMCYLYFRSYQRLKQLEERGTIVSNRINASRTVMRRGMFLVSSFYGCWSVIIICGIITAVDGHVPTALDMVGAWMAKCMPIVDSMLLLRMLSRIERRNVALVVPVVEESPRRIVTPPPLPQQLGSIKGVGSVQSASPRSPKSPIMAAESSKAFDYLVSAEYSHAYVPTTVPEHDSEAASLYLSDADVSPPRYYSGHETARSLSAAALEARRASSKEVSIGRRSPMPPPREKSLTPEEALLLAADEVEGARVTAVVSSLEVLDLHENEKLAESLQGTRRISLSLGESLHRESRLGGSPSEGSHSGSSSVDFGRSRGRDSRIQDLSQEGDRPSERPSRGNESEGLDIVVTQSDVDLPTTDPGAK